MTISLITGITGQDGSYLAEALLERGHIVHGVVRRTSSLDRSRLAHLYANLDIYDKQLFLHYADLNDTTAIRRILAKVVPAQLFHLAGQSHVGVSFEIPEVTCDLNGMATLRILEMLREMPHPPRFLHASSSEIFGDASERPQTETTPLNPTTPYGCSKAFATQLVRTYRRHHNLFACNSISYNHESPKRGENFVTRKICRAAASIKLGLQKRLCLGNLDARRDWSDARDIVRGYMAVIDHHTADDFILSSGQMHSIRELATIAFCSMGLKWEDYVDVDEKFFRPSDPAELCGNCEKARHVLGWKSTRSFSELIEEMTCAEYDWLRMGQR